MKRIALTLAILFISTPVWAVSLEELQNIAVSKRDLIKFQQADMDIRKEKVKQSRGAFLPSVDLEYSMKRLDDETSLGEQKKGDSFRGGISINLFAGMGDYYTLKAAGKMENSGQFDLKSAQQDIRLKVALKYLDVYRSIENANVTRDASRLYKDRFRQIELKYQVGLLKKSDLLRVKVELDNAVQNQRKAEARVKAALNLLVLETGGLSLKTDDFLLKTDKPVSPEQLDFSIFDTPPQPGNYDNYEKLLLANRSEINALKQALKAAKMRVKASRAAYYPRADLSLHYKAFNRDDYFYASPDDNEDEIRAQAMISMNLFNGMTTCSKTKEATLEKMKIRYSLKELENSLKTLLKNTLLDSEVAFDNLAVAGSGKEEANENLRVTDLAFSQGLSTSSDVLDAIFNLSRARFNLVAAYTEVFEKHFRLQRLVESF